MNLPQFESVRKLIADNVLGSSGDCYPDFPLREVVSVLQKKAPEIYAQLDELFTETQLGQKGGHHWYLLGPDFYFYNHTDALSRIIPSEVMKTARDAVLQAQEGMQKSEASWVEQGYEPKYLGGDRRKPLDEAKKLKEGEMYWMAEDGSDQDKVAKEMKAMLFNSETFVANDLPAGEPLFSSLVGAQENQDDIVAEKISDEQDPHNVIGARREAMTMAPQDHHKLLQHQFGMDAINLVAGTAGWGWPINKDDAWYKDNYDTQYLKGLTFRHRGIDFSHKSGKKSESRKMDVVAALPGKIIKVSPKIFKEKEKTWRGREISTKCVIEIQH